MKIEDIKDVLKQLKGIANPSAILGVETVLFHLTEKIKAYNYVISKLDDEYAIIYMNRAIEEAEIDAWGSVLGVLYCEDLTLNDDYVVIPIEDDIDLSLDLDNLNDIDIPF